MSTFAGTYKTAFNLLKSDILYTQNKMINDERITGKSCKCKDLVKFYAAIQYAQLVKMFLNERHDLVDPTEGEKIWETKFEYQKVKKCLGCKGIDLDAILTIYEVI